MMECVHLICCHTVTLRNFRNSGSSAKCPIRSGLLCLQSRITTIIEKSVVIDGRQDYVGGVNLADEYINEKNDSVTGKIQLFC